MLRLFIAVSLVAIIATGCGGDDPVRDTQAFGQEEGAVADDATGEANAGTEPADAGDNNGGEDATFPPVNPQVMRPEEFVDLTGMASVEIEIADNVFRTRNFIVDPGTEIVFVNVGRNPHNVVPAADGAFERIPDTVLEEGPAVLVLDAPGDYPFFCSIHGGATFGQTGYAVVAGS